MPRRLAFTLVLLFAALGVFAGVARALDFDDEDPHPPWGEVGKDYSYEIGTHAGCLPHRIEVGSGQLPPGLSIRKVREFEPDNTTFVLEGIPTEAGEFSAWLHLRDCDDRSAETLFEFTIYARTYSISTQSLKPAVVNAPYNAKLEVTGPPSNNTWKLAKGALPEGLTLSKDGVISGTPTKEGSYTFTVAVTGDPLDFTGARHDSKELTLQVLGPLAVGISRTTAEVRAPFRLALNASGGQSPYTWTATGLPPGVTLSSDGTFSGKPRRTGVFTINALATDSFGATKNLQVRVRVLRHIAVATRSLPAARSGRAYRVTLSARGGVEGKRWSLRGSLPRGLKLDAASGKIFGVARGRGSARLTVVVRDALGGAATKTLVLVVR